MSIIYHDVLGTMLKLLSGIKIHQSEPAFLSWLCWQWMKGGKINVRRALPARERLAKTGWTTHPVWIGHPFTETKRLLREKQASGWADRPGGRGMEAYSLKVNSRNLHSFSTG